MVHTIYIVKLLVLQLVIWTLFLELFGIGGTWGPLAAHFKPMTGGGAGAHGMCGYNAATSALAGLR